MELVILIALVATIMWYVWKNKARSSNLPPGPPGLPIIGNLLQLGKEPHKSFIEIGKTYGDIFSIRLGLLDAIILNNPKDIKDAFGLFSLCGRPLTNDVLEYCGGAPRGVLANSGHVWLEQRRFLIKILASLGFGQKRSVEPLIMTEVDDLLNTFKTLAIEKKPFVTTHIFNAAVLNVMWSIITGSRFATDDPELHEAIEALTNFVTSSNQASVTCFFPWLEKVFCKIPGLNRYLIIRRIMRKQLSGLIDKEILKHRKNFNPENEPSDFIDMYLKEIERVNDPSSSFYKEEGLLNLGVVVIDLFLASSETTSTTLSWVFLLLAMHPSVQEKLFEEIRDVVGQSRLPTLSDRPKMPYTEAVITEVMRYSSMVPISICHCATEDTCFKNYKIKKNSYIIPNLYAAMQSESIWGDPKNFRPERFLAKNEDGSSTFIKHDAWLPFSTGKRICIGLNLAMNELFLMVTSTFQRYRVEAADKDKGLKVEYSYSAVLVPAPQQMRIYDRSDENCS